MATACNVRNMTGAQQPQLCTDLAGTYQYGVVITLAWNAVAYKFNASTKAIVDSFDLSTIAGNPLGLPVYNVDDHYALSCYIDGDGYVWITGNTHTEALRMVRSTNPNDISAWTTMYAGANYPFNISGANSAEYNIWNRLSDGTSLWFFSQPDSSTNSRGRDWLAGWLPLGFGTNWLRLLGARTTIAASSGGTNVATFAGAGTINVNDAVVAAGFLNNNRIVVKTSTGSAVVDYVLRSGTSFTSCTLVSGSGTLVSGGNVGVPMSVQNSEFASTNADIPQGLTADRVYIIGVFVAPANIPQGIPERIHVWGIWRTEDEDVQPADQPQTTSQQQPFYLYCDSANLGYLNAWKNADGSTHTMPITWANRASAQITSAPPYSIHVGAGVAVDTLGQPYVVMSNMLTNSKSDPGVSTYRVCWFDKTAGVWSYYVIPTNRSGSANGPKLVYVHGHPFLITEGAGGRIRLRADPVNTAMTWFMGPPVGDGSNTTPVGKAENAEANPDPIQLQQNNRLDLLLPDGDTPTIHSFGNHHRAIAS